MNLHYFALIDQILRLEFGILTKKCYFRSIFKVYRTKNLRVRRGSPKHIRFMSRLFVAKKVVMSSLCWGNRDFFSLWFDCMTQLYIFIVTARCLFTTCH